MWTYAICHKSAEVLRRRQKDFKVMNTYKYAAITVLISMLVLIVITNIDPATIATQSDFERGEAFTYKRILYATLITLVIGILFMYRNALKLLTSAEKGNEQSFSNYYKTYLLLIFLPWIAV
jgi:cytochrome b561